VVGMSKARYCSQLSSVSASIKYFYSQSSVENSVIEFKTQTVISLTFRVFHIFNFYI
jgi:hypothetical protein